MFDLMFSHIMASGRCHAPTSFQPSINSFVPKGGKRRSVGSLKFMLFDDSDDELCTPGSRGVRHLDHKCREPEPSSLGEAKYSMSASQAGGIRSSVNCDPAPVRAGRVTRTDLREACEAVVARSSVADDRIRSQSCGVNETAAMFKAVFMSTSDKIPAPAPPPMAAPNDSEFKVVADLMASRKKRRQARFPLQALTIAISRMQAGPRVHTVVRSGVLFTLDEPFVKKFPKWGNRHANTLEWKVGGQKSVHGPTMYVDILWMSRPASVASMQPNWSENREIFMRCATEGTKVQQTTTGKLYLNEHLLGLPPRLSFGSALSRWWNRKRLGFSLGRGFMWLRRPVGVQRVLISDPIEAFAGAPETDERLISSRVTDASVDLALRSVEMMTRAGLSRFRIFYDSQLLAQALLAYRGLDVPEESAVVGVFRGALMRMRIPAYAVNAVAMGTYQVFATQREAERASLDFHLGPALAVLR